MSRKPKKPRKMGTVVSLRTIKGDGERRDARKRKSDADRLSNIEDRLDVVVMSLQEIATENKEIQQLLVKLLKILNK